MRLISADVTSIEAEIEGAPAPEARRELLLVELLPLERIERALRVHGLRARGFVLRSRLITAEVTSIEAEIEGAPARARVVSCLDRGSSQWK